MTVDLAKIEAGLEALAGFDFQAALAAFRQGNIQGELQTAEDVASIVAVFFPEAEYVKDGLVVLGFIEGAYADGTIRSAAVEDPVMQRVTGSHAR